jgi:hypothetical protein
VDVGVLKKFLDCGIIFIRFGGNFFAWRLNCDMADKIAGRKIYL